MNLEWAKSRFVLVSQDGGAFGLVFGINYGNWDFFQGSDVLMSLWELQQRCWMSLSLVVRC